MLTMMHAPFSLSLLLLMNHQSSHAFMLKLRASTSTARHHHYYYHHNHHQSQRTESTTRLFVKQRKNNDKKNNKTRRRIKTSPDNVLAVEKDLIEFGGYYPIIGSDESGRGSIAGPVVAASCAIIVSKEDFWSNYQPIEGVGDSKTLTPETRQRIYNEIINQPNVYAWKVATRSNTEIDKSNILLAAMEAFSESIEQLVLESSLVESNQATAYSIVDGKKSPKLSPNVQKTIPCRPWVKGDAEVYTVALASIIARVTIDQLSKEWHELYPQYRFDVHKGYATKEHIEAIHKYGPCPLHRMSFKSLKGR